ncbi:MAG TPA: tetratricopeptide repeat protein [Thermoguttaceae bacterium]|nr:tetratricopeptide repeat protein [Thermoguttaceae bacterium]
MSVARCSGRSVWVIALLTATMAGCASLKTLGPPVEDISKKRLQRSEAAARRFDRQCDVAEFEAAQARWNEGNLLGCAEILQRILARSPDHLEARLLLAESLLADNRPTEAIPYLEPALATHPSDARAHHLMGLLLDATGQRADALVYYERATRLRPDDEVYAVSYQMLASEESEGRPGNFGAPDALGERLPTSPGSRPEVSSSPGNLRSDEWHGQETGHGASGCFGPAAPIDRAQEVEPQRPSTICILSGEEGKSPTQEGASPEASLSSRSDASRIDDFFPQESPQRLVPHGTCAGRIGGAGPVAGNAYASDTADASAAELIEKGLSAMSDGTSALAFAYFREAMALKPDDPRIPISAAISALGHNQPKVAVVLLEPLLEVFPDSAAIRRVLGAAYYRLGDYQSSQVVLQQALSLDKSSGLSYFLMGCTLAKLGQLTAAETHFCQARRLDPRYAFRR